MAIILIPMVILMWVFTTTKTELIISGMVTILVIGFYMERSQFK